MDYTKFIRARGIWRKYLHNQAEIIKLGKSHIESVFTSGSPSWLTLGRESDLAVGRCIFIHLSLLLHLSGQQCQCHFTTFPLKTHSLQPLYRMITRKYNSPWEIEGCPHCRPSLIDISHQELLPQTSQSFLSSPFYLSHPPLIETWNSTPRTQLVSVHKVLKCVSH